MSRVQSVPFLRPDPERIAAGNWLRESEGAWSELEDRLQDWDYATTLRLKRSFALDVAGIRADCGLSQSDALGIAVTWKASGTRRRGRLTVTPLESETSTVIGVLEGAELGGTLHLYSQLLLLEGSPSAGQLTPSRAGSILWHDRVSTHLEGEAPMFPIESMDFSASGMPSNAGWFLEWQPEAVNHATLGTVRLFLNSQHELVNRAAFDPDADETAAAVTSAIRYDVLRQLVEGALDSSEYHAGTDYPPGTVGSSMDMALTVTFPNQTVESIRTLRKLSRSDFEARIQAVARLFAT